MRHNLEALGLSPVTQREFWAIFAAVVLLGDVEIKADADGNAVVFAVDGIDADSPHALARACVLVRVHVNEFEMALLSKPVGGSVTGSVTTAVRLQRDEAAQVRDAMSVSTESAVSVYALDTGLTQPVAGGSGYALMFDMLQ